MTLLPTRAVLLLLALLVVRAWGGDIDWSGPASDKPPEGWELHASPQAKPTIRFERGELAITVEQNRFCHVDRLLKGLDGSDESPLRVDCAMAIDAGAAVDAHPALIALYWGPNAYVAVGLGDGGEREQVGRWRNRAWLCSADGKSGAVKVQRTPTDGWFYSGTSPAHLRLVVTTRAVSAYASADGSG